MKTLHLLRHAKSSWKNTDLSDAERPLNRRGRRSAELMAPLLAGTPGALDNVFSSTAIRAVETLQRLADHSGISNLKWQCEEMLYTFHADALLAWIEQADDALDELTILGHNPALLELAQHLSNEGVNKLDRFPTCAYAAIQLPIASWSDCASGGTLITKVFPREQFAGQL